MNYKEYIDARQGDFNKLPVFFAFNNEQFKEGMESVGLTENDTDKIYALGAGGYFKKSDKPIIDAFFKKKDELPELMKDPEFAVDAFYYEMCNHEYGINWQGDWDVCECFGNCEFGEEKSGIDYLKEMGYGDDVCRSYMKARSKYNKTALENDWF